MSATISPTISPRICLLFGNWFAGCLRFVGAVIGVVVVVVVVVVVAVVAGARALAPGVDVRVCALVWGCGQIGAFVWAVVGACVVAISKFGFCCFRNVCKCRLWKHVQLVHLYTMLANRNVGILLAFRSGECFLVVFATPNRNLQVWFLLFSQCLQMPSLEACATCASLYHVGKS